MTGIRVEAIDIRRLQRPGLEAERDALARRMFDLWQPLFSHLEDKDHAFHLHKHVEDTSAAVLRAYFAVGRDGADRGLLIFRVHEHELGGRHVARLTCNVGMRPDLLGSGSVFWPYVFREGLKYRARHPLRQFFIVDAVASPGGYLAYRLVVANLLPSPGSPIPDRLWPIVEAAAEQLDAKRVEGRPRQVRDFGCVVAASAASHRPTAPSARSHRLAAWFEEQTGSSENGLLVVAPGRWSIVPGVLARIALRVARARLRRGVRTWLPRTS